MTNNIQEILDQIKIQYQFQSDKELALLLEGLADKETKGVTYWDYIEVDTLLSLQKTKTNFPDEVIFIAYHQIHELYFKLMIQELEKITRPEKYAAKFVDSDEILRWKKGLERVTRYMNKLIGSVDVLKDGLDKDEFKEFRKSLLPASGFQTHQFRVIEIMLTSFENLIKEDIKKSLPEDLKLEDHFEHIYWRSGVTDKATGKPAKILVNFNTKYDELFKKELEIYSKTNLYSRFLSASSDFRDSVKDDMIKVEESILMWKIAHLKTVAAHIPVDKIGTGGTNWAEYLPVKNQKIYYFPRLWQGQNINEVIRNLRKKYPDLILQEMQGIL